jgi:predicted acyltransferase
MEIEIKPKIQRLRSLDALRGFDMFWIIGGGGIFVALADLTGWPVLVWWKTQLAHVAWHGFRFEDMIFPLFLFIAGISFPLSMASRYQGLENRKALYRHIVQRALTLVLLGIIVGNGVRFNFGELRYGSVLGHIGLAWMFAALIFMNSRGRTCLIWLCGILVGYWLLLRFSLAPDLGSTDPFSMEGSLVGYVDRLLMPGHLYKKIHDPEGLLSTVPAIATALLGMLTGQFVMSRQTDGKPSDTVIKMVLAAAGLIAVGLLWDLIFPINKNLWTSSFVCFVGGLSLLLFSLFYVVIDISKVERWAQFFVVIGMNSITIYLGQRFIDFDKPTQFFFGGAVALFPKAWSGALTATAHMAVVWLFLYFLYRKKIFIKV